MASILDIFNPQVSRVARTTDNLVILLYGRNGVGKTPQACRMEKPYYLAFGKSGLEGMNNVKFAPLKSWSDFKMVNKQLCNPSTIEKAKEMYQTIIFDEMEVASKYCQDYVASTNGVNKIKEGNGGYGLWGDWKDEWEGEILRLIGSGFCVIFITHAYMNEDGRMMPVGDEKRTLPIIMNHASIIGYVRGNGVNPENGRTIHSSLGLASTEEYFARTRNPYFSPTFIEDFTAENLISAYYDAVDRQAEAEGINAVSFEEREALFKVEEVPFEELMNQVQELGEKYVAVAGIDALHDITEAVLGKGKRVIDCTVKQKEAIKVILNDLKNALNNLET